MTRLSVLLLTISLLVTATIASAQQDIRVGIQRRGFDQFAISVDDFDIANEVSSSNDSTIARNIARIIRNDLSFHVAFEHVKLDSFLLEVLELDEMTNSAWHYMGSDYLVAGKVTFGAEDVSVNYTIWDLNRDNDIRADGFRTRRDNYRRLAHVVSDAVVREITAMKPIFNSRIAFISAKTGNKEVYACDYDGARVVPLTSNGSINLSPVWAPDGNAVYYTSYKDGRPHLWRVDLQTSDHTKVAAYPGINSAAAISPHNDEICLTLTRDDNAELYILDLAGNIKRRLTRTRAIESGPSFGPAGYTIAFSSDRTGSPQVYVMDRDGLNVHRVTFQGNYNDSPSLSPDGTKVAFVTRSRRGAFDICVVDITGENFRIITDRGANENPHWSPDGYHLVYSKREGDRSDIYIADFRGMKERKITDDGKSSNPFWSPIMR